LESAGWLDRLAEDFGWIDADCMHIPSREHGAHLVLYCKSPNFAEDVQS
jgi:hypothetical protein